MKQEERTELTRKKIMKAAVNEFGTYGYEGGTIGRICKTGNINKGLIYHNFKDKDALYLACMKESCDLLMDMFKDMDQKTAPEALGEAYMRVRMHFFTVHPLHGRILFEGLLMPPAALQNEIHETLSPLEDFNRQIIMTMLDALPLRSGISRERAIACFRLVADAYNARFRSDTADHSDMNEKIEAHEKELPKIIDCMLYGIAEKRENKE